MPFDYAGNTLSAARGLELTPSTQTFTDWVGPLDTKDFYSFTLSGSSSLALSVDGMSADANVRLLNSTGQLLQTATNLGTTPESIKTTLSAGTYYLLVLPGSNNASTSYNLSVSANQSPQELQFNTTQSTGTVSLTDAKVYDGNSYTDLSTIDFRLQTPDGSWQDIDNTNTFTALAGDTNWASFNYQLSNLTPGDYILSGRAYDQSGAASNEYQTTFTVAPYITITSPNGGESWQPGSIYNITWNDNIADNVKLELYKDGTYDSTISSSTASDGSESWTVPTSLASGSDYQLRITSLSDSSVYDDADNDFSVAPYITITSPNGGESWQPGSTYNITWNDNIADNVKLELYKDGTYDSTISSSTASDGSESWTVPTSLASGSDYQLRITSLSDSSVYDDADNDFSITLPLPPALISNLVFSGNEGDSGTFQIKLNQAPTSNVTLTFNAGSFLTIDADNVVSNGTNNTITFTATNWNQARTVWFIAENDGSSSDRTSGNTIGYTLSGGASGSGTYNLGNITNTYAPDTSAFNIELDFRNDYLGVWTPERQAIAQQAADDWASLIASELSGLTLTNQTLGQIGADGTYAFNFTTNQYVDDLVVFVGAYEDDSSGAWGGMLLGGSSETDPLPRVGGVTLNASVDWDDETLYSAISHEIGHTLGLLGMNYTGYQLVSGSGTSWFFTGAYSKAYNNGEDVPMKSEEDGGGHPADSVVSILSYDYIYSLSAPSEMDKRFLADSGYLVYGINT
ncbi:MAG TPA: GPI anchored serine-threonine rich family protein [Leptolyngbyaceae cyanobacterium]